MGNRWGSETLDANCSVKPVKSIYFCPIFRNREIYFFWNFLKHKWIWIFFLININYYLLEIGRKFFEKNLTIPKKNANVPNTNLVQPK